MNEAPPAPVTAALVIIGDEVLSGRTQDINVQYLATRLTELGIRMAEVRIVPDSEDAVIEAVNALRARVTYLFTTGGIGPTHDDITTACVSKAFGLKKILNAEAVALMEPRYEPGQFTEARKKMCETPEGAALIENPVSVAPGYIVENVHVMAGIPRIMQAMFESIAPSLAGGAPMLSRSLTCYIPEGAIATGLSAIQDAHPACQIGSYPFKRDKRYGATLVVRATDRAAMDAALDEIRALAMELGSEAIEETGNEN